MLPDAIDASDVHDATRRAFLKKVAISGAAAAIGSQVLLVPRAGAQEDDGQTDEGEGQEEERDSGGDDPTTDTTAPSDETESEEGPTLTADEQRMTFLASVSLAAASVYRAATGEAPTTVAADEDSATTTTPLDPIDVPLLAEPVVEVVRVFGSHHAQQAVALNGSVPVVVELPNDTLLREVRDALGQTTDETTVLAVLLDLEERIAATHLAALGDLDDTTDASLVGTALPVIGQHAVVLGLIGATPVGIDELVPVAQSTGREITEADYPVEAVATEDTPGGAEEDANAGGEGADPGSGSTDATGDGTGSSGGGGTDGTDTGAGSANDPESEG